MLAEFGPCSFMKCLFFSSSPKVKVNTVCLPKVWLCLQARQYLLPFAWGRLFGLLKLLIPSGCINSCLKWSISCLHVAADHDTVLRCRCTKKGSRNEDLMHQNRVFGIESLH